jgi:hypothetical protein
MWRQVGSLDPIAPTLDPCLTSWQQETINKESRTMLLQDKKMLKPYKLNIRLFNFLDCDEDHYAIFL